MARRIGKKSSSGERREVSRMFNLIDADRRKNMSSVTQPPRSAEARKPVRTKAPCAHMWEYVNGPDNAANWICSRCEAEMVAPVANR